MANIRIPAIGVDWIFLEGVDLDVLANGPGHYEGTPQPGEEGNAAIAGHRTTYGQPFNRLDELGDGDEIVITYPNGSRFTYEYLNTVIVTPDRTDVLEYKFDNRLTLTACHPKYSAAERIVVSALLREPAAPARPLAVAGEIAAPPRLDAGESLDGQDHPKSPAIAWGLAAAMVWSAAWVVGRAWRRWPLVRHRPADLPDRALRVLRELLLPPPRQLLMRLLPISPRCRGRAIGLGGSCSDDPADWRVPAGHPDHDRQDCADLDGA